MLNIECKRSGTRGDRGVVVKGGGEGLGTRQHRGFKLLPGVFAEHSFANLFGGFAAVDFAVEAGGDFVLRAEEAIALGKSGPD